MGKLPQVGSDIVRPVAKRSYRLTKRMISIVVGVSLVPTIVASINTAKSDPNIPTGLAGLLDVLSYVFVAVILLGAVGGAAALRGNLHRITSQIRGSLEQVIPSQAGVNLLACVETRWEASLGMVV